MAPNLETLLAALREASASSPQSWSPEDSLTPLRQRIEELEHRVLELAASPQEEDKLLGPPQPPDSLALFLKSRVELLESKLEFAQRESLRANLLLREREQAQRQAQKEVEGLFRAMKGQTRTPNQGEEDASLAAVMGRISDLEKQLEETRAEKDREREIRLQWEKNLVAALDQVQENWRRGGGARMLVEATLESLIETLRFRDSLHAEMERLFAALREEPPESTRRPDLHAQLDECRQKMNAVQDKLEQQMSVVQAWTGSADI